jgi:hypothetical protein
MAAVVPVSLVTTTMDVGSQLKTKTGRRADGVERQII